MRKLYSYKVVAEPVPAQTPPLSELEKRASSSGQTQILPGGRAPAARRAGLQLQPLSPVPVQRTPGRGSRPLRGAHASAVPATLGRFFQEADPAEGILAELPHVVLSAKNIFL